MFSGLWKLVSIFTDRISNLSSVPTKINFSHRSILVTCSRIWTYNSERANDHLGSTTGEFPDVHARLWAVRQLIGVLNRYVHLHVALHVARLAAASSRI